MICTVSAITSIVCAMISTIGANISIVSAIISALVDMISKVGVISRSKVCFAQCFYVIGQP